MRYASEHKARSRERILEAAARQLRSRGPDNVGVAEVMADAGLTHGAFYAHFESKGALVAAAVETMFGTAQRAPGRLSQALADESADIRAAMRAFLEEYLSQRHRDGPERGCPLPALATDLARSGGPARDSFAAGATQVTRRVEAALARLGHDHPGAEARTVVAQMVGAVALARAMGTGPDSDAWLRENLDGLVARLSL